MRGSHRVPRLLIGWLASALAAALLAGCAPTQATPSPTAAAIAPTEAGPPGGQDALSAADTVEIYAVVARRLCTRDDSFGGTFNPAVVYLVRRTDDKTGDPSEPASAPAVLPEAVQQGITAALGDLPARLAWVDASADVPKNPKTGEVEGHGTIVTLGNIHPQEDGSVHVAGSVYMASLAASGQTYVLQKEDGAWVVTGNTGVRWIS